MPIHLDWIVIAAPGVLRRKLDSETVLLLPEKAQVKVVNEVAGRIWDLIDGKRSVRQIITVICQEYQVDEPQATQDALAFLEQLAQRGMLHNGDA